MNSRFVLYLYSFYDIFERTFPYIHIPQMQPIPMALLEKFERHVDDDILEKLKDDVAVFEVKEWGNFLLTSL
jgi:hypothetical protein